MGEVVTIKMKEWPFSFLWRPTPVAGFKLQWEFAPRLAGPEWAAAPGTWGLPTDRKYQLTGLWGDSWQERLVSGKPMYQIIFPRGLILSAIKTNVILITRYISGVKINCNRERRHATLNFRLPLGCKPSPSYQQLGALSLPAFLLSSTALSFTSLLSCQPL